MAKYDFRILLETSQGKKTSYVTQSFVDTSVDLVLSSSQVYNRITGSISCSYQNSSILSGSDFNKNFTFKDNTLLSASLSGSDQFGFIKFTALADEYDRLKRYKFIGEKVCTTLGLPNEQWIYVDQARFPVDDELNYFEGNVNANTIYISDNISFSPTSNVLSHITYNIDTGSDKFIRFVDERPHGNPASDGTQKVGLRMGYDVDVDKYEIGSDITSTFSHTNTGFSLLGVHEISSSLPNVAGATNKIKIGTANLEIQGKGGVNLDFINKDNAAGVSGGIYARFSQDTDGDIEIRNRIEDRDISIRTDDFNRAIYIKDSTERVGVGTNSPSSKLEVDGDITATNITASGNISASGDVIARSGSFDVISRVGDPDTRIYFADDDINIMVGGVNMVDFTEAGSDEITFNEQAADLDVRIEGDTDANLFFTNAGTNKVGIGTNTPTKKLQVAGDISSSGNVYATLPAYYSIGGNFADATEKFLGFGPSGTTFSEDADTDIQDTRIIAAFDGYVHSVILKAQAAPGSSTVQVFKATSGVDSDAADSNAIIPAITVNMSANHTPFRFSFGSTYSFVAGDTLAFKFNPAADPDSDVDGQLILMYNVTP